MLGIDGPEGPRTVLRAAIVARNGALSYERVIEHCRLHLGEPKVPRNLVFLPALPRDSRGKLDRAKLAI